MPSLFYKQSMNLKDHIRTIPNYPKPGIMFRDVTTLMGGKLAFEQAVDELAEPWREVPVDLVAGIEARGFIFGGAMALALKAGFLPLRKSGKLPAETISCEYSLEYGTDVLEVHKDAVTSGVRVLLFDDLIATGGTASAGVQLLRDAGATIIGASFLVDLPELGGSARLKAQNIPVETVLSYQGH